MQPAENGVGFSGKNGIERMEMRAMKKLLWLLVIILMLGVVGVAAHAEEQQRSLTLMVYMCGSNLESGHGAASADIEEMKAAVPAGRDVTILIMTGGTFCE